MRQIDRNTSLYYQVVPNVNSWSNEILNLAENASYRSLEKAITIAQKVPSGTIAHGSAEAAIARWQARLNPTPIIQKREKSNSGSEFKLNKERKN